MRNKILKTVLVAYLWGAYTLSVKAQPTDPPGEDDPIYQDPTPIDNWMLLLILASVVVGVYFIVKYERKRLRE